MKKVLLIVCVMLVLVVSLNAQSTTIQGYVGVRSVPNVIQSLSLQLTPVMLNFTPDKYEPLTIVLLYADGSPFATPVPLPTRPTTNAQGYYSVSIPETQDATHVRISCIRGSADIELDNQTHTVNFYQ